MGIEIERRFLVANSAWRAEADAGTLCRQGYLAYGVGAVVRVRVMSGIGWLTVKSATAGLTRAEFEYPVPVDDAEAMLALCGTAVVEKRRHLAVVAGHRWEIDVFSGANAGLVLAEIELSAENEMFEFPAWVGPEVSDVPRFSNAALARHPFAAWSEAERATVRSSCD